MKPIKEEITAKDTITYKVPDDRVVHWIGRTPMEFFSELTYDKTGKQTMIFGYRPLTQIK